MFCGIVDRLGKIVSIEMQDGCKVFCIKSETHYVSLEIGESIAINGICLTVTQFDTELFQVTAVPETLRLTNLNLLKQNDMVNLERALTMQSRIGGHYVQGHVDAIGEISSLETDASNAWLVKINMPESLAKYIVKKGFITLDGMSITVIDVGTNWFTVTLIPHTQQTTITQNYHVGSVINIEVDMMGKYIEKLLGAHKHAIST